MINYDNLFNEKLGELMKDIPFGEHEVFSKFPFNECVLRALTFHSEDTLGVTLDEYEKVADIVCNPDFVVTKWLMPEMFIALKAVRSILPHQCNYGIGNWIGFKRHYYDLGTQWDAIAAPYIEQAKTFVNDRVKEDNAEAQRKAGLKNGGKRLLLPS